MLTPTGESDFNECIVGNCESRVYNNMLSGLIFIPELLNLITLIFISLIK